MQRFKRIKEYYKLLNKHRERLPSLWVELCECPARVPAPSRSRSRYPSQRRDRLPSDASSKPSRKPSAAAAAAAAATAASEHLLGVPPGPAADADADREHTRSVLVRPVLIGQAANQSCASATSGVRVALPSGARSPRISRAETPTPVSPAVSFVHLPSRSSASMAEADSDADRARESWVTSDPCAPTARQVASASFEEIIGAILDDMQAILGTSCKRTRAQ